MARASQPRTAEMKKHPPWYAPGPGLGDTGTPRWTQSRMFTNWNAFVAYRAWRERTDHGAVTSAGNFSVDDRSGGTVQT